MTKGFIAGVDISRYRIEKHRTEEDDLVYQLIDSDGIEEYKTFAGVLSALMYLYHYPTPDEYAALYALREAK